MRILDQSDNEIEDPNLEKGYLQPEQLFIKHHRATKGRPEKFHYEVVAEYENGGQDVKKVIDKEAIEPSEAWDEYEDILRYISFEGVE